MQHPLQINQYKSLEDLGLGAISDALTTEQLEKIVDGHKKGILKKFWDYKQTKQLYERKEGTLVEFMKRQDDAVFQIEKQK